MLVLTYFQGCLTTFKRALAVDLRLRNCVGWGVKLYSLTHSAVYVC